MSSMEEKEKLKYFVLNGSNFNIKNFMELLTERL